METNPRYRWLGNLPHWQARRRLARSRLLVVSSKMEGGANVISEALVATAVGLLVAIIALAFYNYLQVRVGQIQGSLQRACDRFIQALLYVESGAAPAPPSGEVTGGNPLPA